MHESSSVVSFCVPFPPRDEPKPVPLLKPVSFIIGDVIAAIVRSADKFYKPRIPCRRKFTMKGVQKYYPAQNLNLMIQSTFLYGNSIVLPNVDRSSIYKVCEDFILAECFNTYRECYAHSKKARCDTFYMLDCPSSIRLRPKTRSGGRCGNSFTPLSFNSVSS